MRKYTQDNRMCVNTTRRPHKETKMSKTKDQSRSKTKKCKAMSRKKENGKMQLTRKKGRQQGRDKLVGKVWNKTCGNVESQEAE